jgi:short-subunit dehydrogenase
MDMSTHSNALSKEQKRWRKQYGPWALVTGASEGIGRELALRLGEAGLNLVLVARRRQDLEQLATELCRDHGIEARVISADLATREGLRSVTESIRDLDLGLLVAAAGFGTSGPLLDSDLEDELDMLDVNCRATLVLTHELGRRFARRGRGGIVLLSSIVAFQGVPRAAHYAATKAWVQTLAEGLRPELGPFGVDVVAAAPGPVASGFARRAGMQMGMALTPRAVAAETLTALGRRTTVRPGWLSKLLEAALTLPRSARVRIMTQVMRGMTRHQDDAASQAASEGC